METIHRSIDVNVPVSTAYNQWTQFESFPKFMPDLREVQQLDDRHIHWKAEVMGKDIEWDSEITHQVPDKVIQWRSTKGPENGGYVEFSPVTEDKTRITLHIDYEPKSSTESVSATLGIVDSQAEKELESMKKFLESRGHETGAWRGKV